MVKFWSKAFAALLAVVVAVGMASAADKEKGAKGDKPQKSPEERFKALDKNIDGAVSLEEFTAGLKKHNAPQDKIEKAEADFKAKDKNNDGKLSLEEFTAKPEKKGKKNK